jgi:hypothetical protein
MIAASVAVAVDESPYVVLDEEYRIVEIGHAAEAGFAPMRGQKVFDCFVGSRPLFFPYYEAARKTKKVVEFA